jgi:DNA-binding winged helix-turn-helix (wHTH) protein
MVVSVPGDSESATIAFGAFTLNPRTRQLTRRGREVHLSGKAFELLLMLASARPNALAKATLQKALWPSTFVAEANLSNLVAEVRLALRDNAREPIFIRTVHRYGYAFCADARSLAVDALNAFEASASCWIEWGQRRFPLAIGAHVIGRDEDASVRIDAATVSRRHAQLVVTAGRAVLQDSGSKNGTFRGTDRITAPATLADGDAIRIGTVLVTFHTRSTGGTTRTATVGS